MKRLHELTPEDLMALTMEQIDELVSVECAHRGVPLPTQAPAPPEPCSAQPDVQCFRVNVDVRFGSREEAEAFVQYLHGLCILDTASLGGRSWEGPYELIPRDPDTDGQISQERHWTPAHHLQHAKALERYKRDKEAYDKNRREFESTNSERTIVTREVWGAIEEARDAHQTAEHLRSRFLDYCKIADGDEAVALKFLLAATPHDEEFVRTTLNMEPKEKDNGEDD